MEVKIPLKCGRCGRTEEKSVQMEEAQALVDEINKKADVLLQLKDYAVGLPANAPAVIMFVRAEGGFKVKTLDNLCEKPDAKRNKGCAARVNELLASIFELHAGEKKERKPRAPKAPKADGGSGNGSKGRGSK